MVMEEKNMKIIDIIMSDIADYIKRLGDSENLSLDGLQDSTDVILTYLRTKNKVFSAKRRVVIQSKYLQEKVKKGEFVDKNGDVVDETEHRCICDLIDKFSDKFENGEDVTNHSSKNIFSTSEDYILNNWNLRHLHLSNVETSVNEKAMSGNRSNWLLFYILTLDEVYFVDVLAHPKGDGFTAFNFLEIIQQSGWMEKIGFFERQNIVPDSLEPKITKNDEIYNLIKNHINLTLEVNGRVYSSFGVSNTGYSTLDVINLNLFKKELGQMLEEYKYIGFQEKNLKNAGFNLIYKSQEGHIVEKEYVLFDTNE